MDPVELDGLINLLKSELEAGKVTLNSSEIVNSLSKVRTGVDGKVDPLTVDGSVRALARAVAASKNMREQTESMSLQEVQAAYFDSLSEVFGDVFQEMQRRNVNPQIIAEALASNEKAVAAFVEDMPAFASSIEQFWEEHGPAVQSEISHLSGMKSVFGGDLFPSYISNIACSVGLYIDTLILPDPLLRIVDLFKAMPPKEIFKYSVKHALNALQYRELALADVQPPIVVIAPDFRFVEPGYRNAIRVSGELDLLEHAAHLFNRKFSSADDLLKFVSKYNEPAALLGQIADPSRVLFDAEWSGSLADQFARLNSEIGPLMGSSLSSAEKFYRFLLGRMGQANDVLFRSKRYVGTPLVDAPTSWQYLLWKYEYDGRRTSASGNMKNLVISKAVQVEGRNELGMLAGVPPETLIRLRKEGALANLREILSKGIGEIDSASSTTLTEVADKVIENVDAAFSAHAKDLKDLSSSKRKFYGFDIGRWIAVGGLSIAAASLESRGLGILATASAAILGSPSGPDVKKGWEELKDTKQKLERSPTGMLFRHLKGKFGF
ncbi:MAG TPA: hypothetical protein VIJ01_19675 [Candidatus Angelobacter sp.]